MRIVQKQIINGIFLFSTGIEVNFLEVNNIPFLLFYPFLYLLWCDADIHTIIMLMVMLGEKRNHRNLSSNKDMKGNRSRGKWGWKRIPQMRQSSSLMRTEKGCNEDEHHDHYDWFSKWNLRRKMRRWAGCRSCLIAAHVDNISSKREIIWEGKEFYVRNVSQKSLDFSLEKTIIFRWKRMSIFILSVEIITSLKWSASSVFQSSL